MATALHWVEGRWLGRLALAARPRGDDWMAEEFRAWKREGVATVVSLLVADEAKELGLRDEAAEAAAQSMAFISFPIPDREVPASPSEVSALVEQIQEHLAHGRNVAIHCRQGVGRAGLIAACLLIAEGASPSKALERLSSARGVPVPETEQQREWVEHFAANAVVRH